jgi:hypothetical protein
MSGFKDESSASGHYYVITSLDREIAAQIIAVAHAFCPGQNREYTANSTAAE